MEIKVVPYTPEAVTRFAPTLGDYSEDILRSVRCGHSYIWQLEDTHYIVTIEQDSKGKVLVVLCAVGEALARTAPRILEQAKNMALTAAVFTRRIKATPTHQLACAMGGKCVLSACGG